MTKEVAKTQTFALATMDDDMGAIIMEEMAGLGNMPIDPVKIPSGGSLAYEWPSDDPDNPDMVKSKDGIILTHHAYNAYWENSYNGANSAPDCYSGDGKTGIDAQGCVRDCASCPMNQYSPQGGGKKCKNGHAVYFLTEGAMMPVLINLPPTSIRPLRDYIARQVVLKKKRAYQVITRLSLKKDTNASGIAYSKVVLTKVGELSPEEVKQVLPYVELAKGLAAQANKAKETAEPADWNCVGEEVQQEAPAEAAGAPEYEECTLNGMK